MNKKELVKQLANQTGLTIIQASQSVDALLSIIKNSLEHGDSTMLHGFGSFSVINRAERKGVNPVTKQPMIIPARKAVKFVASQSINIR